MSNRKEPSKAGEFDTDAIKCSVGAVIARGVTVPEPPRHKTLNTIEDQQYTETTVSADGDLLNDLECLLHSQTSLKGWNISAVSSSRPNPQGGIGYVAKWLVRQAYDGIGIDKALIRVKNLALTNTAKARIVIAIHGLQLDKAINLCPGFRLVPFGSLPKSSSKAALLRSPREPGAFVPAGVWFGPDVALIHEYDICPVFIGDENDQEIQERPVDMQCLMDIVSCLTVAGINAPLPLAYWHEFCPDYPVIDLSRIPTLIGHNVLTASRIHGFKYYFDDCLANEIVDSFTALSVSTRDSLRVPLQRLNLALRRSALVDVAIELRIALEAILLSKNKGSGELKYRMQCRAARLLGNNLATRKEIFDSVKEVYDLCSGAVHTGQLGKKINKLKNTIWDGVELCCKLIRKIIERGEIPDWSKIEMGD